MPLSEHEQRLLEQIERAFYADDPKFAATVRLTDLRVHRRRRIARLIALFVVGLAVLVLGAVLAQWIVGVVGFAVMLFAAVRITGQVKQLRGRPAPTTRRAPAKASFRDRVEARWNRRWEDRGR